jgi:hypothetical protein
MNRPATSAEKPDIDASDFFDEDEDIMQTEKG